MVILESNLAQERALAEATLREAKMLGASKKYLLEVESVGIEDLEHPRFKTKVPALKVYYQGVYGFIPKELMDEYDFRSLQAFVGGKFKVIVSDVFKDEKDIFFVANRKDALAYQEEKFWESVKVGFDYDAFISGVDRFAVWLLIDGARVKMPKEEFSYSFIRDMREEAFVGDTIRVRITDVNKEDKRVQVSRRVFEADPKTFLDEYKVGSTYSAVIENVDFDRGVFISLNPRKVVALANFPSMRAANFLKPGAKVNFKVKRKDDVRGHIHGVIIIPELGQLNRANRVYDGR